MRAVLASGFVEGKPPTDMIHDMFDQKKIPFKTVVEMLHIPPRDNSIPGEENRSGFYFYLRRQSGVVIYLDDLD